MSDEGVPSTTTPGEWVLPDGRTTYGPPTIDVIFMNIDPTSDFRTIRKPWYGTVAQMISEIAKAANENVYRIINLNASTYSVVLVVQTTKSSAEIRAAHPRNSPSSMEA